MSTYTNEILEDEENSDIIQLWEPLEVHIDKKYEYEPNSIIFQFFSNVLYYGIAFPILKIVTKLVYDLKIEGKENIRNIKGGAVTVSNHVLFLDCAMVGLASGFKKIYYTTREESFKIPFVRKLIKLLRAIPIPKGIDNKKYFMKSVNHMLQTGNMVHFYPEAAMHPYCEKIRKFKNGAFSFAIHNHVPVVPMVFKFREPKGIRKILKRKKDVTLVVLEPIIPKGKAENNKADIEKLKKKVYEKMQ